MPKPSIENIHRAVDLFEQHEAKTESLEELLAIVLKDFSARGTSAARLASRSDVIWECSEVFDHGTDRFRAMRAALRHFAQVLEKAKV